MLTTSISISLSTFTTISSISGSIRASLSYFCHYLPCFPVNTPRLPVNTGCFLAYTPLYLHKHVFYTNTIFSLLFMVSVKSPSPWNVDGHKVHGISLFVLQRILLPGFHCSRILLTPWHHQAVYFVLVAPWPPKAYTLTTRVVVGVVVPWMVSRPYGC